MTPTGRLVVGLLTLAVGLATAGLGQARSAGLLTAQDAFTTEIPTTGPSADSANGVALQPDDKTVVVGTSRCLGGRCEYASIARYRVDGGLDPSFGPGGVVSGQASGLSEATAVAIQPDGKIVVAGVVGATGAGGEARGGGFGLARYLPDGSLDPSFGVGGVTSTEFCAKPAAGAANAVAIQPDGKIVTAGSIRCGENRAIAIARYLVDGQLDPAFRKGWVVFDVRTPAREELRALIVQPDGKIVAVGGAVGKFIVIRLNSRGERDSSFGDGGFVETPVFASDVDPKASPKRIDIRAVATSVLSTGRGGLVVAGGKDGATNTGVVIAYRSDGHFDRGFGRQGFIPMSGLFPLSMTRDRCGRLELAGRGSPRRGHDVFAVAGLRPDGDRRKPVRLVMPFGPTEPSAANSIASGPGHSLTAVGVVGGLGRDEEFGLARLSSGPGGC